MSDRTVPYKPHQTCDNCGDIGAYDFMGDYLCNNCADPEAAELNTLKYKYASAIRTLQDIAALKPKQGGRELAIHRLCELGEEVET